MNQEQILIGGGLIFPIQLTDTGKPIVTTGAELIRSSIRCILAFAFGERFFLREFGANTDNLLDEPNVKLLEEILERQIITAINTYEKRVKNLRVIVVGDGDVKLDVRITYEIKQTQKQDSFIFPFYKDIRQ